MISVKHFPRGAEWRQWDFHIHTPASYEWKEGKKFHQMTAAEKTAAIDQMIDALNKAQPAVFVLMDYWTFEGWFVLKNRLKENGAPQLKKRVFPGIELRLAAPTSCRLNAHVLFSDEVDDQALHDFKAGLKVEIISRPLSDTSLVELARTVTEAKLKKHGFKKADVDDDHQVALRAGAIIAELNCDSYKTAIEKVPKHQAIGFMPYDTSDGLAEVKWQDHYAYFLGLFKSSPIFETRNIDLRGAFVGEETVGNAKWIKDFQAGLGNVPRLAVSGSDAHRFTGIKGDNDHRGYGDFPSAKATWIKADPTFLGLLQAIKEPAKRSFIGQQPLKVEEVALNKTFYIDSVEVSKNEASPVSEHWLSSCSLPLNYDLVAIIGNKGSGKSALADIIALLGNSRQKDHFSFLSGKRFRQKPKELAKHFTGTITWRDKTTTKRVLSDDPPSEAVELVRYIPQGQFEKLCNYHVSGQSDAFEKELRAVIFSHTSASIRQKALDFDQLIEQQEGSYRDQLGEYRKDLKKLNHEIEGIEAQLQPGVKRALEELLTQKQKQIDEHKKVEPHVLPKPSEQLTPDQQKASSELDRIAELLKAIDERAKISSTREATLAAKAKAIQGVRERLHLLQKQYKQFQDGTVEDLKTLELSISQVVSLTTSEQALDQLSLTITQERGALVDAAAQDTKEKVGLLSEQVTFNAKLNEPQQLFQQNVKARGVWLEMLSELVGTSDSPETLEGIKARISQLDQLPDILIDKRAQRLILTGEVFDVLDAQRKAREELFKPVQDLIQSNSLIRDEYKLQFQATLGGSVDTLAGHLFELIKQNSGEFRGDDESRTAVKKIAEQFDLNKRTDVLKFVSELYEKIIIAASVNKGAIGIASILRVNRTSTDVYDLLFGLPFLEPRYSLLFQDTQIEQLSPGQRGALLLIFYLLVDKGHNPIILDQPEENLDNETVVSLLVPVLSEAKKKRQIIMVTHNPNLAVVCDAEQVIYSSFDRKHACKIEYVAGSIENPVINVHVVNVLEGTKPAFDNRRIKYH